MAVLVPRSDGQDLPPAATGKTSSHTGKDATDCYAYGGMEGLLYGLPLAGKRPF